MSNGALTEELKEKGTFGIVSMRGKRRILIKAEVERAKTNLIFTIKECKL